MLLLKNLFEKKWNKRVVLIFFIIFYFYLSLIKVEATLVRMPGSKTWGWTTSGCGVCSGKQIPLSTSIPAEAIPGTVTIGSRPSYKNDPICSSDTSRKYISGNVGATSVTRTGTTGCVSNSASLGCCKADFSNGTINYEYWYDNGVGGGDPPPGAACGSAAKAYLATDSSFSGSKCSSGSSVPASPSFPAQGGSTSWTCGSTSCTATRASGSGGGGSNPVCGPNATSFNSSVTAYPSLNAFCSVGAQFPLGTGPSINPWHYPPFPAQGGSSTWTCCNPYGNMSITCLKYGCTATREVPVIYNLTVNHSPSLAAGYISNANAAGSPSCDISCGVGNGGSTYSKCSTQCLSGHNARLTIQAPINRTGYTWNGWSVNGGAIQNLTDLNITITANTTVTANWTATTPTVVNGACSTTQVNICTAGTYASAVGPANYDVWICNGSGGGTTASCSILRPPVTVNSQCGTAQRAYTTAETAFSGTLCAVGNSYPTSGYWPTPGTYVPTFPTTGGSASWKCVGSTGSDATCTATRAAASASVTLSVTKTGLGSGVVTSVPDGINCGATCSASYTNNTNVSLTATPNGTSTFTGWSGDCVGTGTCTVSMTAAKSVIANFNSSLFNPPLDGALAISDCSSAAIRLTWSAVPTAISYEIYRNGIFASSTSNLYYQTSGVSATDYFQILSVKQN